MTNVSNESWAYDEQNGGKCGFEKVPECFKRKLELETLIIIIIDLIQSKLYELKRIFFLVLKA